ncbi:MAG TPA: helix-turn-helix domain-containing protein, partial [Solirubrobacter sp.]
AVTHARTGIVRIDDHLPELLLHAAPRHAHALQALVYGPLDDELARTLEALVAHGFDKSAAAAALPVHRNTLSYRAAKIERLTGLDLDTADGRGRAWLATLQRSAAC